MVKYRGEERSDRIGFDTTESLVWCQRGIRARQFKATLSGRDGIRTAGCGGEGDGDGAVVDMLAVGECAERVGW